MSILPSEAPVTPSPSRPMNPLIRFSVIMICYPMTNEETTIGETNAWIQNSLTRCGYTGPRRRSKNLDHPWNSTAGRKSKPFFVRLLKSTIISQRTSSLLIGVSSVLVGSTYCSDCGMDEDEEPVAVTFCCWEVDEAIEDRLSFWEREGLGFKCSENNRQKCINKSVKVWKCEREVKRCL